MIRVLVVEDSSVIMEFLTHILSSDPDIRLIGTARNGQEALEAVKRLKPDAITMDINMPVMNGFEATRRIMETVPTPIVIVSGTLDTKEVSTTFKAMEAGALAVVQRPVGIGHPNHEDEARQLVQTVKLMSEVKVVRRFPRHRHQEHYPAAPPRLSLNRPVDEFRLVAIGASTGGPVVLQTILAGLTKDFPMPVLIVQHMAPGFLQGFVDWLSQASGFPVRIAVHGEQALPGQAYVAPDGLQMGVDPGGRIVLSRDEPENNLRPSVSFLFRSVAAAFGKNAVGILLTGMGKDGAEELKRMKDQGALTVVQDPESSVVFGMPGEALRQDAATVVLSPDKMADMLKGQVQRDRPIA